MVCPKCGGKLGVVDNAYDSEGNEIFRRRKCKGCGNITYTVESEIEYEYIRNVWNQYQRAIRKKQEEIRNGS